MFWTIDSKTSYPVTLCESCALIGTNDGPGRMLGQHFTSMDEAMTLIDALMSTVGFEVDMQSSDIGTCEECGQSKQEVTG